MWPWKRRKPLSGMGSGAYHLLMPDTKAQRLMRAQAIPATISVYPHDGHWYVRFWIDRTAAGPLMDLAAVYEVTLDCHVTPEVTSHLALWTAVALEVQNYAEGVGLDNDGA